MEHEVLPWGDVGRTDGDVDERANPRHDAYDAKDVGPFAELDRADDNDERAVPRDAVRDEPGELAPLGDIDRIDDDADADERAVPRDAVRDEPGELTPLGDLDRNDGDTDERVHPPEGRDREAAY